MRYGLRTVKENFNCHINTEKNIHFKIKRRKEKSAFDNRESAGGIMYHKKGPVEGRDTDLVISN